MILEEFGIELAPESVDMTYNEARLYCFTLTHDNKIGWRMPNYDEWCCITGGDGWWDDPLMGDDDVLQRVRPVRDLR